MEDTETNEEKRTLPARSKRGNRLQSLIKQEAPADEDFYKSITGREEVGEDNEFTKYDSEEDVVDSDFELFEFQNGVAVEEGQDEEAQQSGAPKKKGKATKRRKGSDDEEEEPKKKKSVYVDPVLQRKKQEQRAAQQKAKKQEAQAAAAPKEKEKKKEPVPKSRMSKRATTKSKTAAVQRRAEEEEYKKEFRRSVRGGGGGGASKERPLSQEELLAEAKVTEQRNRESLQQLMKIEEEKKKLKPVRKQTYTGPLVSFRSKGESITITFTGVRSVPQVINARALDADEFPKRPVCQLTGKEAPYKDPMTGTPYATMEAFKIIRRLWEACWDGDYENSYYKFHSLFPIFLEDLKGDAFPSAEKIHAALLEAGFEDDQQPEDIAPTAAVAVEGTEESMPPPPPATPISSSSEEQTMQYEETATSQMIEQDSMPAPPVPQQGPGSFAPSRARVARPGSGQQVAPSQPSPGSFQPSQPHPVAGGAFPRAGGSARRGGAFPPGPGQVSRGPAAPSQRALPQQPQASPTAQVRQGPSPTMAHPSPRASVPAQGYPMPQAPQTFAKAGSLPPTSMSPAQHQAQSPHFQMMNLMQQGLMPQQINPLSPQASQPFANFFQQTFQTMQQMQSAHPQQPQ